MPSFRTNRRTHSRFPVHVSELDGAVKVSQSVTYKLVSIPAQNIVFAESQPVDLDRRARDFVDLIQRGVQLPPILVEKLPSGGWRVIDGHARLEAYRRLGVKEVAAVEKQ